MNVRCLGCSHPVHDALECATRPFIGDRCKCPYGPSKPVAKPEPPYTLEAVEAWADEVGGPTQSMGRWLIAEVKRLRRELGALPSDEDLAGASVPTAARRVHAPEGRG